MPTPSRYRTSHAGPPGTRLRVLGSSGVRPAESLAKYVREQLGDGQQLIDFWCAILRDESADLRDRRAAAKELADRGWGRSITTVDVMPPPDPTAGFDLSGLDDGALEFLASVYQQLRAGRIAPSTRGRIMSMITHAAATSARIAADRIDAAPAILIEPDPPDQPEAVAPPEEPPPPIARNPAPGDGDVFFIADPPSPRESGEG